MATTTSRIESLYNEKRAGVSTPQVPEKGPIASTQTLIDALNLEVSRANSTRRRVSRFRTSGRATRERRSATRVHP
jgi:hypothetical protein